VQIGAAAHWVSAALDTRATFTQNGIFGWSNRFNSQIDAKTIPDGWLAKVEVAFPPRGPQRLALSQSLPRRNATARRRFFGTL
jgi:hypothetical protein